jgi:hypothetical protein
MSNTSHPVCQKLHIFFNASPSGSFGEIRSSQQINAVVLFFNYMHGETWMYVR